MSCSLFSPASCLTMALTQRVEISSSTHDDSQHGWLCLAGSLCRERESTYRTDAFDVKGCPLEGRKDRVAVRPVRFERFTILLKLPALPGVLTAMKSIRVIAAV